MSTITKTVELTTISCGECGGTYAIAERYRAQCQAEAKLWNCPYCQTRWGYPGKTAVEKERDRVAEANRQLARERASHDQTRADRDHKEAQRRAERGAKTKLKKRVAAGVCPCCNRTFQDLSRHMAGQHPDFVLKES
jgi:sRNA-binding protein